MQLVTHPEALPASCCFCPGSVRERYIDTGVQYEWYGAFYICDECVLIMGRMIGMISAEQAEALITGNADAATENYELKTRLSSLEGALHGLADAGYLDRSVLPDAAGAQDDAPVLPEGAGDTEDGPHGTEAVVGGGEGTPAEQVHDEGVGELRSDEHSDAGRKFSL